jgi:glutaconyl-CoA/methylmalonyl-CoA decarboxylase subunit delta
MMQELGLMQRFADPALFDSLTSGEKVIASLVTTLMGMGVTFAVLVLLWAAIAIMARILKSTNAQKKNSATVAATTPTTGSSSAAPTTIVTETASGAELIAVIMAAIAASEGTEYTNNLIVRKINRVSGGQLAWSAAGSADCIDSRKI